MAEVQQENCKRTRVYVEGHGCSASFADSEMIGGLLERGGYQIVNSPSEAEVNVLVTCSVKSVTEQRMLNRIKQLSETNGKKLVVAGCLSKAEPGKILQIDPTLSMIGPGNLDKVIPAVEATLSGSQLISTEPARLVKVGLPRTRKNEVVGIVEISSGCLSSCTFCQVKLVKGMVFSYHEDAIVAEVESLISQGAGEIWLTSTDNSAYGKDTCTSLPKLLSRVCALAGNFMIRVGMMNPLLTQQIQDNLIDSFTNPKVFKFLHLPVQSGSNRILKDMQRGYSIKTFHDTVKAFRMKFPELTLSTDIIVGFPTESQEEFEESMDLLRKSRPDVVNISRFGARDGTKAAKMKGQISSGVSKERSSQMTSLVKEISASNNLRWVGWEGDVLIDEIGTGALIGRNFAYKPCLVKSENMNERKNLVLGMKQRIRITDSTAFTLRGVPI